jgi:hypothetical protein
MAINLTCQCGKKLAVKEEMAGKKVKCPGCGSVLTVPSGHDDAAEEPAEIGGDAEPSRRSAADAKKSGKTIWIVAGVGVLLLSCCCLGVVGVGAVAFLGMASGPEKAIIGKWTMDVEKAKNSTDKRDPRSTSTSPGIEFKSDGAVLDGTPMTPVLVGKWKTLSTKDNNITVEVSAGGDRKKLEIKVIDQDHLTITPEGMKEFYFKRAN